MTPDGRTALCHELRPEHCVGDRTRRPTRSPRSPIALQRPSAGVAVTPDSSTVYVAHDVSGNNVGGRHGDQRRRPRSPIPASTNPPAWRSPRTAAWSMSELHRRHGVGGRQATNAVRHDHPSAASRSPRRGGDPGRQHGLCHEPAFNIVSVIAAATNAVTKITDPSFSQPVGISIIRPSFAGTPQFSNCHGESVAALAQKYGGLSAAAEALTLPRVKALQDAVRAFCGG